MTKSYRGARMASYRLQKQRTANTYAVAVETPAVMDKPGHTTVTQATSMRSIMEKFRLNRFFQYNSLQNLIPSILYEKKAPKGKPKLH